MAPKTNPPNNKKKIIIKAEISLFTSKKLIKTLFNDKLCNYKKALLGGGFKFGNKLNLGFKDSDSAFPHESLGSQDPLEQVAYWILPPSGQSYQPQYTDRKTEARALN